MKMYTPNIDGIWKIRETYIYFDKNGNDNLCSPDKVTTKWRIKQNDRFVKMVCIDNDYLPVIGVWDQVRDKICNVNKWRLRLADVGDNGTIEVQPSKIRETIITEMTYTLLRAGFVRSLESVSEPTASYGIFERIN